MGELETLVMAVLWERGQWMTTSEVHDAVAADKPIAYTTVNTILTRLWRKGRLERLQERDLVEELTGSTLAGEREFAFKHALIPDVAYSTLPKAARSIKHLGFAEWLERVLDSGH